MCTLWMKGLLTSPPHALLPEESSAGLLQNLAKSWSQCKKLREREKRFGEGLPRGSTVVTSLGVC
eukprot:UN02278